MSFLFFSFEIFFLLTFIVFHLISSSLTLFYFIHLFVVSVLGFVVLLLLFGWLFSVVFVYLFVTGGDGGGEGVVIDRK